MAKSAISLSEALGLLQTWRGLGAVIKFACINENNLEFSLVFRCTVFSVARERVTLCLEGTNDIFQFSLSDCIFEHWENLPDEDSPMYDSGLAAERKTSGRVFLFMQFR
jgi:hypothetical protein